MEEIEETKEGEQTEEAKETLHFASERLYLLSVCEQRITS